MERGRRGSFIQDCLESFMLPSHAETHIHKNIHHTYSVHIGVHMGGSENPTDAAYHEFGGGAQYAHQCMYMMLM